jgi:hypothetical protein
LPERVHVAMLLGGAGWHTAGEITAPADISLVDLPPTQPEPEPDRRVRPYLRERFLSLRLFANLGDIIDGCCDAWNRLIAEPGRLAALTDYPQLPPVRTS